MINGPEGTDEAAGGTGPSPDRQAAPAATRLFVQPDPTLVAAVARDLARGRRIVALTWLVALALAGLCLIAVREVALLANVDGRLVTTTPVEDLEAIARPLRGAFVVLAGLLVVLAVRWLRTSTTTMEALAAQGVVDRGTAGAATGPRRFGILLRPAGVPAERVTWRELRIGSGRRIATAALGSSGVAVIGTLLAASAGVGASSADEARAAQILMALALTAWIVATILTGALFADINWRLAVAARAAGVFAPMSDAPGRLAFRLLPAALLLVGLAPMVLSAPAGSAETGSSGDRVRCGTERLECAAVEVPVDHAAGSASGSLRIVYGVHRAFDERVGTLVVAVGGPGASGLASADGFLRGFDPELLERYDIVFWDQRGIGRSDGHDCPIAGGIFSGVATDATSARRFVDACITEADADRGDLRRYATAQAAEDLESIRQQIDVERFALYGESYGTELAQTYAAAHPDRVSALILDGAVDLTLSANDFWSGAARSFDRSLDATFEACEDDEACADQVQHPAQAYDRLLKTFDTGDRFAWYADPNGVLGQHRLGRVGVESAVAALLYEPSGRMLIQRAVAGAAAGDYVPLSRLVELVGPGIGPVSSFAYHAILCADYRVSPTANAQDYDAVIATGRKSGALFKRTDEIYLTQIPCLYWPGQPASAARPRPLTDLPAPIFVLGAELDPITPIEFGRSIVERARDGYLIETGGGPHVTFGRGNPCVDRPVVRYLVRGTRPATRSITCSGTVSDPYIRLPETKSKDFADAREAVEAISDEMLAEPRLLFWDGSTAIKSGCRFGGTMKVSLGFVGEKFTFDDCEMADGMVFSGTGDYDFGKDRVTLEITFEGGALTYVSGADGSLTGTFRGLRVDDGT